MIDPKLLKEALASAIVVAPTVTAAATRAGDVVLALTFEFPAAIVQWIPLLIS